MGEKVTLRIWRGGTGQGEFTGCQVEASESEVALDIPHRLQATQAGDLAVRWNCKAGKSGSCRPAAHLGTRQTEDISPPADTSAH